MVIKSDMYPETPVLRLTKGAALFIGPVIDTGMHRHHAIQISFGIEEPFMMYMNGESLSSRSIIMYPDIEHKLVSGGKTQVLFLVEPESYFGGVIKKKAGNDVRSVRFDNDFIRSLSDLIRTGKLSVCSIVELISAYWNVLPPTEKTDDRIRKAIHLIESSEGKNITVTEISRSVALSGSRLQHLFKNSTGISIKRYLLWKRMIDGVNVMAGSKTNDLTYVSYESGFADLSHMSRTFKSMFGITLSDIFKDSRSVQVIIDAE